MKPKIKYVYADPSLSQQGYGNAVRPAQFAVPIVTKGGGGKLGGMLGKLLGRRRSREVSRSNRRPMATAMDTPFLPVESNEVAEAANTARTAAQIMQADERQQKNREVVAQRMTFGAALAAKRNRSQEPQKLRMLPIVQPAMRGKIVGDPRVAIRERRRELAKEIRANQQAARRMAQKARKLQREANRAKRRLR